MKRLGVFCGSKTGNDPAFEQSARTLGRLLGERGVGLVYGGGNIGLMGAVADATLAGGSEVIGVIPGSLAAKEIAHDGLSTLYVVESIEQRKQKMIELADGFMTLPGGFGSLDECLEVLTLAQLGYHEKPSGLLNVAGFYDPLLEQFDRALSEGLLTGALHSSLHVDSDPARLLDTLSL